MPMIVYVYVVLDWTSNVEGTHWNVWKGQSRPHRINQRGLHQSWKCRINFAGYSRSLPRNCILAFLREPKRITLVHLYHTWLLRCVCMHKLMIPCQTMSMFCVCLLTTELNLNCRKHTLKKIDHGGNQGCAESTLPDKTNQELHPSNCARTKEGCTSLSSPHEHTVAKVRVHARINFYCVVKQCLSFL